MNIFTHHSHMTWLYTRPMFKRDAVAIKEAAAHSPDILAKVITFVILTANAPLRNAVKAAMWMHGEDILKLSYANFTVAQKSLFGASMTSAKLAWIQSAWAQRETLHKLMHEMDAVDFWEYGIYNIPGLGMVKSAFTVQMLYNELGCIDTHNLKELGLDRKAVQGKSKAKLAQYLDIQSIKTSEQWWVDWCNYLASQSPHRAYYPSGDYVSLLHRLAVLGV